MRLTMFAGRNLREMARDPLTLFFGIAFPLVLLLLLSAIQANIPVAMFEIDDLAPGMAVFGQCFLALFAALLIAKDRTTALTRRLYASPMRESDFILGYVLPMFPMALCQSLICLLCGGIMGMRLNYLWLLLIALTPSALVFIALGLLFGSVLTDRQAGGICGALLTNLTAWLSGIWFDVKLAGKAFEAIANALPFIHGVRAAQAAVTGDVSSLVPHLAIVSAYAIGLLILAVLCFRHAMQSARK